MLERGEGEGSFRREGTILAAVKDGQAFTRQAGER